MTKGGVNFKQVFRLLNNSCLDSSWCGERVSQKRGMQMKSKKMLAQIAAFSLVFGMTGVVSSLADEIILDGTTVKFPNDAISLVKNEDGSFSEVPSESIMITSDYNFIDIDLSLLLTSKFVSIPINFNISLIVSFI